MKAFIVKITNEENVNKILSNQSFTHQDIYNFRDEIEIESDVFIVFGGDRTQISWEQGLVGFGKVTKIPYDIGYDQAKPRNFKIDIQPGYVLSHPIPPKETKLHRKYSWELYDAPYVGANHFPNQAIAKAEGETAKALFSVFYDLLSDSDKNLIDQNKLLLNVQKQIPLKIKNKILIPKPFMLLAGISGTGKSRFVRKQAEKWPDVKNFELVSVRPDWHEPSDLLGYVLRLKDKPEFISTPVIQFLVSAWLEAYNQGITLTKNENNQLIADCTGKQTAPFWLCLDEMNLAPVEQYFADYLSVLETREWNGDIYSCDPLIKPEFLKDVINENESQVRKAMGLKDHSEDNNHDELWKFIKANGLPIPFNLIVAGTVNMDETTHGFSRKVIDRALGLDFGEFAPNSFGDFFKADDQKPQFKTLTYPTLSHAMPENVGQYANETVDFLNAVNAVLKGTLFELAYRALNECLLAVACEQPEDQKYLQAVWDDFLMMKVLPRIEGDEDKLQSTNTGDDNLFIALENLLKTQFDQIWEGENRPDLLRDNAGNIACRSKKKIKAMQQQLENGFTSFWP